MRKSALAALTPLALALAACAGQAEPELARYAGQPGYECSVGQAFEDGVWITRSLDRSGRQVSANMEWRAWGSEHSRPRISTLWRARGADELRLEDGLVFVSWSPATPPRGRPPLLRMELTTDPAGRGWHSAPFAGVYERGQHSLHFNWPDMAAFARGAVRLAVVLRDRRGAIADQAPLDPALFARGAAEIAAALERMRALSADFRSQCRPVDDLDPEIVVT